MKRTRRDTLVPVRWIDRLAVRQRVVLVVALGVVLSILGGWLTTGPGGGGWFGYAPNTGATYVRRSMRPAVAALVRVGLTIVWAAASVRLLRSADRAGGTPLGRGSDGGPTEHRPGARLLAFHVRR